MLEIIYYNGSEEEQAALTSFDPKKHTLVCTNLRIKKQIQVWKISKEGWLPGASIQRAREFWQKLYLDSVPSDTPLGHELCSVYFSSFMETRPDLREKWPSWEGLENQISNYFEQLLPLLNHSHRDEILTQWQEHKELPQNKLLFVQLCQEFYDELRGHGQFFSSWCPHLLNQVDGWWERVPGEIFFHLHAELGLQEAELIGTLSRYRDVKVLAPAPRWQKAYPKLFRGYSLLTSYKHNAHASAGEAPSLKPVAERFSSTLSESKEVVAKVRAALEAGATPEQIMIMAPRIEDYWQELFPLLQAEGVPFNKPVVHRLHGFYDVQVFLSRLRNALKKFRLEDVELGAFGREAQPAKFVGFQEAAGVLLEWSDLSRLDFESYLPEGAPAPKEEVSREEFLNWCLGYWPQGWALDRLELLIARYLHETQAGLKFRAAQGVRYLESIAAQIEVTSQPPAPEGVQLDNLGGGLLGSFSHVFCLGLAQESFDVSTRFLLSPPEVSYLERTFGLNLEESHFEHSDFCLEWACVRQGAHLFFGFSEVDLSGAVLSPSLPWLKHFGGRGSTVPALTQWELQCTQRLEEDHPSTPFIQRDLGLTSTKTPLLRTEVSASGLEDYFKCPFIYLMKRGFRFPDRPELDMDISALDRGSMVHRVLELLIQELQNGEPEPDFESLLGRAQEDLKYTPVEDEFWAHQRQNLLELAKRFWESEIAFRKSVPKMQTVGLEIGVQGHFDVAKGQFGSEATDETVPWSGRIDRVDGVDDEVVLYDYKSTAGGITSAGKWLEKGRVQMLAYALAVEAGLTELGARTVVGAYYYPLKPLGDLKGLQIEGHSGEAVKTQKGLKREKWEEIKVQTLNHIQSLIQKIRAGEFDPKPRDEKDCETCSWRAQCRAPHLI